MGTRTLALVVATILAAATACSRPPVSARLDPSSSGPPSTCATCHSAIAAEWRDSHHRVAFSDATFQGSLALEDAKDRPFCTDCHAHSAKRSGSEAGIDCVDCHATPHTRQSREVAVTSCTPCHEFTFPGRKELIQKTASEHALSSRSADSCVACHMHDRGGHKDHRFVSSHDPASVSQSVHLSGSQTGAHELTLALTCDAGHDFPTGDMFRRARLQVFAEDEQGRIVGDAERVFGRTWGPSEKGDHPSELTQRSDTRVRERWSESFAFADTPAPIARVRWVLLYERPVAMRGPYVSLASSDGIAGGELAWR